MKKTIKNPISKNWDTRRYKFVFSILQGLAFKSEDYVNESDVVNIRMGNIKKGGKIDLYHNTKYLPSDFPNRYPQYLLHEDDLIISMTDMSPSLEFLAVPAKLEGLEKTKKYLLNQRVGKLIFKKGFDPTYIKYTLLSESLRNQLKSQGLGTVQSNMSNENLYASLFFVPKNIEEQKLIASYLDKKTEQIDRLVGKIQKKIELLKEQRTSLINHYVTKGLNPNVEMKDSGVEWLGEIPKLWDVKKLKYLVSYNTNTLREDTDPDYRFNYIEIGDVDYIEGITFKEKISFEGCPSRARRIVKPFDVIISTVRTYLRAVGTVPEIPDLICSTGFCVLRDQSGLLNQKFLSYVVKSEWFISSVISNSYGVSYPAINASELVEFKIVLPSMSEQERIVGELDERITEFDEQLGVVSKRVELFREYRQSLISSVVTGKVRVTEDMI